ESYWKNCDAQIHFGALQVWRAAPSETPAAPQRVWLVIGNLFNLIILLCLLSRRRRTCVFGAEAFFSQSCAAANLRRRCLLWVKTRHSPTFGRCPLYPQKRTWVERVGMSALCQRRTSRLFDDFVGAGEQRGGHNEAERFRCL